MFMPQQETLCRFERADSVLELWQAPRPRQVAEPLREPAAGPGPEPEPEPSIEAGPKHGAGWVMTLEVLGNVVVGSAWLGALLAAPAVLGRLLGLL
jgi:hypothetical protein